MNLATMAEKFFGVPYVWAGNNPTTGVDCSGFVCEVLRSLGVIGKKDYTAQMLYDKLQSRSTALINKKVHLGYVVFFGDNATRITHVAISYAHLTDHNMLIIEAGGEGRKATDKGYVRIRPLDNRNDTVDIVGVWV